MTKHVSTKRAFLLSVLSLVLCMSMLVGSTFAWFTDSASTGVNKIQSGILDVALEVSYDDGKTWENAEGKTLDFVKAPGYEDEDILWEPGCTYELPMVRVKNNGNLWLEYQIIINGIQGEAKLNEAIVWTMANQDAKENFSDLDQDLLGTVTPLAPLAASKGIIIRGHMKEEAGNEYQNLTMDGIGITVIATQKDAEHDSYDNIYDADASYYSVNEQGEIIIDSAAGLFGFANEVNKNKNTFAGKVVKLVKNIDLAGYDWTAIGGVVSYPSVTFAGTFDGQGHTIKNMHVVELGNDGFASAGLFGSITGEVKNLTIDNANVVSSHYAGGIVGFSSTNVGMAITNCKVTNSTITSMPELVGEDKWDNGDKAGGIIGYMVVGDLVDGCTVENTTIKAYRDLGGIVGHAAGTVINNTVKNVTLEIDYTHNYKNYAEKAEHHANPVIGENAGATVSGNTVNGSEYVEDKPAGSADELKKLIGDALSNPSVGDVVIELTNSIDVKGQWEGFALKGYNGVNNVTIKGNGYVIKNLNQPLLTGSFAGNGVITIENLTIEDANISGEGYNGLGLGAFLAYSDASGSVVMNDCHLVNSKINCTGEFAGGLIGYSSSKITIQNCSVTNCEIISGKSAGAIIGQDANAGSMDNITVTGCKISATGIDEGKKYCGTIVGTSNAATSVYTNVTTSGNTINGVEGEAYYGRAFVGLTINGEEQTLS